MKLRTYRDTASCPAASPPFSDIDIWGTEEAPAPNVETVDNNKTEILGRLDWCSGGQQNYDTNLSR